MEFNALTTIGTAVYAQQQTLEPTVMGATTTRATRSGFGRFFLCGAGAVTDAVRGPTRGAP